MRFRKVLVTGSSGFIGRNLIKHLESKQFIVSKLDVSALESVQRDVYLSQSHFTAFLNHNSLTASDSLILHFGANADARSSDIKSFNHYNVESSRVLFESSLKVGIPVIFASSAAIYGSDFIEPDARVVSNLNPYAYSKYQGEIDLQSASAQYGTPFTILRLFNVYGSDEMSKGPMMSIPSRFCLDAKHKGEISIWNLTEEKWKHGKQSRDFIHVEDLLKAIGSIIDDFESFKGIFDLGRGLATSFISLAETIADLSHSRITFVDPPSNLLSVGYQKYTRAGVHRPNIETLDSSHDFRARIAELLQNT